MSTVSPNRVVIQDQNDSIEGAVSTDRDRFRSLRLNSQYHRSDTQNIAVANKNHSFNLSLNRNHENDLNPNSKYCSDLSRDRLRPNSSKVKHDDSISEQSHYVQSNSKRSATPEREQEQIQEYLESKLLVERRNIEEALGAFWEKRIEEISKAYQEKIDSVRRHSC